jgi:hypothetical protein
MKIEDLIKLQREYEIKRDDAFVKFQKEVNSAHSNIHIFESQSIFSKCQAMCCEIKRAIDAVCEGKTVEKSTRIDILK